MSATPAEANKLYLENLDKQMTIQGILAGFAVAAAGGVFVHVLSSDQVHATPVAQIYGLAAIIALFAAAGFFNQQRQDFAWLHGQLSYAIACNMLNLKLPDDTYDLENALGIGNSWSVWNSYRFALSFLCVCVVEGGIFVVAIGGLTPNGRGLDVAIAGIPFLFATIVDLVIWRIMYRRDETLEVPKLRRIARSSKKVTRAPHMN